MPTLNSYLAWLRFEETTGALKYYWWTIFLDVLIYTNICTLCITIHRHIYLVYTYTYVRVGSLALLFCLGSGRTLALQFTDKKVDVPLKYTYRKYLNLQKIFEPTRVCTLCITIHRHIFLDVLLYTNSLSPTNSQAYLNLQNLQSSPTRQQLTNTALPNRTHVGHPAAPAEEAGDQPTRAGGGGHKAGEAAWRADPEGKQASNS